jgi:tetratricopeptide (TPR) repeat protein
MPTSLSRCVAVLLLTGTATSIAKAQTAKPPLTKSELLALVAGNVLCDDEVRDIESRGLAFRPNDEYSSFIATAGGDSRLLDALKAATIRDGSDGIKDSEDSKGSEGGAPDPLLQHLATAGKLLRDKQYPQATAELVAARELDHRPNAAFVMGTLLGEQGRWSEASKVYDEVLAEAPDYPQAHTKLSYALYRAGDVDAALREARIALAQAPESVEAHTNAGLALQSIENLDAAQQEFGEAVRLKPDCEIAIYDLGMLFYEKGNWDDSIAQYKKAIAIDSKVAGFHYNLGLSYEKKSEFDAAIREYREGKRLDPNFVPAREALGSLLLARQMYADALSEFRELEAIAPDAVICHACVGRALSATSDFQGAEEEFNRATELDSSGPGPK